MGMENDENETRETTPVDETERLWRVPRQVEKELRNQCRCARSDKKLQVVMVMRSACSCAPQV